MKWLLKPAQLPLAVALVTLCLLVVGSILTIYRSVKSAHVTDQMLRAMLAEPGPVANRPFPCTASPLETIIARRLAVDTLERMKTMSLSPQQTAHLLGTNYCMLGDIDSAQKLYETISNLPYVLLQQTVLDNQAGNSELSAQRLIEAGLGQQNIVDLLQVLVENYPELDWRPHLRRLAGQCLQDQALWRLWMGIGSYLDGIKQHQIAFKWYQEGLAYEDQCQISVFRSSLYFHAGLYYQAYSEPLDYQVALTYYTRALTTRQYMIPSEQVDIYIYRGEAYRALNKSYTPAQALAEFERALALDPKSYWAELSIGHVYFIDLNDPASAEPHYRQAVGFNPELPYACYYLGELFRTLGNMAQAEAWYRQALARQPDFQPAIERLKELGVEP